MRIAATVDEIPVGALDRVSDCLYSSSFLRFVEREHSGRARVLYFYEGDESALRAFTVGYVYQVPIPLTFRLGDFIGDDSVGSYLVVNVPFRLRSRVLADDQGARVALIADVLAWAREERLSAVVLPFVLGSDHTLREVLDERGFLSAFYEGDFYLPVQGDTLEEFLVQQPPGPRKQLRNDLNRFRRSAVELLPVSDVAAGAASLARMHEVLMSKYGRPEVELTRESFRVFEQEVADQWVVVAQESGRDVGFAMSMFDDQTYHLLRYGRSETIDENARIYGNLVYLESLRKAIELGCQRVHFGKASHRAKALRGCRYEEGIVYAYFLESWQQRRAQTLFPTLDASNRQRFGALISGCPPPASQ